MRRILIGTFCLIFPLIAATQTIEKSVIATAGETFSSNDVSLEWTLGELSIEAYTTNNIVLTQGFHQPNISITGIFQQSSIDDEAVFVYPNPTHNLLYFEFKTVKAPYQLQLYSLMGELLFVKNFEDSLEKKFIDLSTYADGTYLINFQFNEERSHKVYQIIKN